MRSPLADLSALYYFSIYFFLDFFANLDDTGVVVADQAYVHSVVPLLV